MTWKESADRARAEGYPAGNPWEGWLSQHLRRLFPELSRELGAELPDYLVSQTWSAMKLASFLESQGSPPDVAQELALERLLPRSADEENRPKPWEVESSLANVEAAAAEALLSPPPSPKPRPRQIRLT